MKAEASQIPMISLIKLIELAAKEEQKKRYTM
jgi:hypothetical protein